MQASLAIVGGSSGSIAIFRLHLQDWGLCLLLLSSDGALATGKFEPSHAVRSSAISINRRLMEHFPPQAATAETRRLMLERWGVLTLGEAFWACVATLGSCCGLSG